MQINVSSQSVQRQRREREKTFPTPSTLLSWTQVDWDNPWIPFLLKVGSRSSTMQGEEEEISWLGRCSWTLPCFWLNQFLSPGLTVTLATETLLKGLGKAGFGVRLLTSDSWKVGRDRRKRNEVLLELTTVSSGVFSQVSHNVSSVSHLLTRARPRLPHQHGKVASSGHMAELFSSSRRIHTWSFTLSLSTLIKLGLLTLNCSCVWKNVGMHWLVRKKFLFSPGEGGRMALTSHIKLLLPFLCLDRKVLDAWQVASKWLWPMQCYDCYASSSDDFLRARNFNRLIS